MNSKCKPVDPRRLWTKSAYARQIGTSPQNVVKMIKADKLTVCQINGGELILQDEVAPSADSINVSEKV